jgi:glutamyl-tRNA synthetase
MLRKSFLDYVWRARRRKRIGGSGTIERGESALTGSMDEFRVTIKALALENAVKHGGKAEEAPVLGKLLSMRPELRGEVRSIMPLVEEALDHVNSLLLEEQTRQLKEVSSYLPLKEVRVDETGLPQLPMAERGDVVTRFSPNPNFVLHLGSSRAAILSHDYAEMYDGRFILRFEDTDPRTKRPELEYYDSIRENLRWLDCQWDEEYIQSQRLEIYYRVAGMLVEEGKAYVCECVKDRFKAYILDMRPCPDRNLPVKTQSERLERMLEGGYGEGEAIVRVKTDLNHPNPAVREWPALRVIDASIHPHPLTGSRYWVWPLYNFSCSIDDHLMGITHIIRGVEHLVNETRQKYLFQHMDWIFPITIHYGRLGVPTGVLSKSRILKGIEEGVYSGYDDPRLATLFALRRRGFQPEALRRVIHDVGIRPSFATIDWRNLEAYNRKIIDAVANRRFVVLDPFKLSIKGVSYPIKVGVRLHPSYPERGQRIFDLVPQNDEVTIYIERGDAEASGMGSLIRIMGFANVELERLEPGFGEATVEDYDVSSALKVGAPIIHWVPVDRCLEIGILWSDASLKEGLGEIGLMDEKPGDLIQMERIGFARVESMEEKMVSLVFTHR